jgi:hypothetical protein
MNCVNRPDRVARQGIHTTDHGSHASLTSRNADDSMGRYVIRKDCVLTGDQIVIHTRPVNTRSQGPSITGTGPDPEDVDDLTRGGSRSSGMPPL